MDFGQLITLTFCFVFFVVFSLVMFWVYGFTPLFHWFIKSNGEPAKAVVLEMRKAGWGWYSGGSYSQSLVFQPVRVKLEVHPNNGAPYVVTDRFNAKPHVYREQLKPGVELQVVVARFNPGWVASLPETIVDASAASHRVKGNTQNRGVEEDDEDPKARLQKLKEMLSSNLITQQEYDSKKKEILEEL